MADAFSQCCSETENCPRTHAASGSGGGCGDRGGSPCRLVLKVHPSPPLQPPPIHMPACPPGPDSGCRPRPPSLAASAARAQVSAPAAVMMIDSPGSPRPLAARAPDRMPTLPPSPLMMVSSGGGAARGARWLRQLIIG